MVKGQTQPKAFVTWTDSFMSGWGRARGKTNRLYYPYGSMEKARKVAELLQNTRSDWKNVRVARARPQSDKTTLAQKVNPRPWLERHYHGKAQDVLTVLKKRR